MIFTATSNGQLIAAVVVLVDAVFGVLVVVGVVHQKPDQAFLTLAVGAAFNVGGYIWAFIQHQQHIVKLQIAGGVQAASIAAGPQGFKQPVGAKR